jgi:hypothetical protein
MNFGGVMRKYLPVVALALTATMFSFTQQTSAHKTGLATLLMQVRSNDAGIRAQAYEQLKSDPAALRDPKVKEALLDLLDREDQRRRGTPRSGDNEDGVGDEEFAEYFSDLAETVASIGNWNDPHQVCILVRGAGVPPSHSPQQAALRERVAWPCLKEMSGSSRILDRADASVILVELSAKAGSALDPSLAHEMKQIVIHALHDQDESVRDETVKSLEKFGTEDMIPALRQIAESDSAVDTVNHTFWIRSRAVKAIAAIQKRAGQQE